MKRISEFAEISNTQAYPLTNSRFEIEIIVELLVTGSRTYFGSELHSVSPFKQMLQALGLIGHNSGQTDLLGISEEHFSYTIEYTLSGFVLQYWLVGSSASQQKPSEISNALKHTIPP